MLRNLKKSANYADIYAILLLSIFERQGSLPCHMCGAVGFYHFLLAVLNWSTPHGPDSACEIDARLRNPGHRQTTLDLAGRGGVVWCGEEGKSAGNVALAKVTPRIPAAVQTQRSADGSGHLIFKTPPLSFPRKPSVRLIVGFIDTVG